MDKVVGLGKNLLTIGESSEYLNVSIDTLRRWEKKGKLNALRSPGGHRYFATAELDTLFGKKYERTENHSPKETANGKDEKKISEDLPQEVDTKTQIASPPEVPSIEDRPTRDIVIPQIQPIRVAPNTQPGSIQIETQEAYIENAYIENAYIEQQKASILTPSFTSQQIPEPQNVVSTTKRKSNLNITLVIIGLILSLVAGLFVFYLLKSPANILSPIP